MESLTAFFDETGHLWAEVLSRAEHWGLPLPVIERIVGAGRYDDRLSGDAERRLRLLSSLLAHEITMPLSHDAWLLRASPEFAGRSPLAAVTQDPSELVRAIVLTRSLAEGHGHG